MDTESLIDAAGKVIEAIPGLYNDGIQPTVKESGKLIAMIPGAIHAALSGLDIWIAKREYKIEEVKILLAKKLENIDPNDIVPPEPHIVVPVFQAISYSMDNDELRNMYTNLLAKSMIVNVRDSVHPAFVEIIKQMSPLDAENLSLFSDENTSYPIVDYIYQTVPDGFIIKLANVFLENQNRSDLFQQSVSISSLVRLGLLSVFDDEIGKSLNRYAKFKECDLYIELQSLIPQKPVDGIQLPRDTGLITYLYVKNKDICLTPLGSSFINTCLN